MNKWRKKRAGACFKATRSCEMNLAILAFATTAASREPASNSRIFSTAFIERSVSWFRDRRRRSVACTKAAESCELNLVISIARHYDVNKRLKISKASPFKAVIASAEASARKLPFAESPWSLRYEVGRLGVAFHHLPRRGQATLLDGRLSLQANAHLSSFSLGFFEPKGKEAGISSPRSRKQPTVWTVRVTPDSDIYRVSVSTATRDFPRAARHGFFLDFLNREQLFDCARVFHIMNLTSPKLRLYSRQLPPDGAL